MKEFFSCVTTPRQRTGDRRQTGSSRWMPRHHAAHDAGPCAGARRLPPAGEPLADFAAVVGVWQLASGAPASGTRDPGSTAVSSSAADMIDRTLCAGRREAPAGGCWRSDKAMSYLEVVPREAIAPAGAARETRQSPSGIFMVWPSPHGKAAGVSVYRSHFRQPTCLDQSSQDARAKRDEGDREGDTADISAISKEREVDRAGIRRRASRRNCGAPPRC